MRAMATRAAVCRPAGLLALAALLTLAAPAGAVEPVPVRWRAGDVADVLKRPRTVALLPVKLDLAKPDELFSPETARVLDHAARVEAALVRVLERQVYLSLRPPAVWQRELSAAPQAEAVFRTAQDSYRQGLDRYLGVQPALAADNLKRAVELYRDTLWQDLLDPKPLADAQFMLGVALVELGRPEGLVALREAFAVQPTRRFRPNFFPPQVNTALREAVAEHVASADPVHPYGDNRRMVALAQRLGVAWLLMGSVRQGAQGPELALAVFSAQRRRIESELRVPLTEVDAKLDAFVSRWLACVQVEETGPPRPAVDPVRLDTSGTYALYLRQPTRRDFHSLGFALGVSAPLRPHFGWFARAAFYTSLSDPNRDLLRAFNSVRLVAGLSVLVDIGAVRLFARPGIDLHWLGDFAASTNPNCKLFGSDNPRLCPASALLDLNQRLLAGGHLAVGAQFTISPEFFLHLQSGVSVYVLPLAGSDRLNFPWSTDVGLGYHF